MTQENLTEKQQEFENKKNQAIARLNEYKEKYPRLQNSIDRLIGQFEVMIYHNMNSLILDFFLNKGFISNEEEIKELQVKMMISYCTDLINYRVSFSDNLINIINEQFNATLAEYKKINKNLEEVQKETRREIDKSKQLHDILKNEKTYEIYKQEEDDNKKKYNIYIICSIVIALGSAILSSVSRVIFATCWFPQYLCFLKDNSIDYWIMKASIIFIAITGVTFCLKQAIHHQKKRDLAEKNRLDLEALPTYMTYFDDEMRNEIYKELLPRFFGQPVDNTHYTNMNSLIDEQLKLSNEILKSQLNKIGANSDSSTESKSKSSNP